MKNIIFDLGGVIINLNGKKTIDAFGHLGENKFSQEDIKDFFYSSDFFLSYETGQIDDEEFREGIRKFLKKDISNQEIDDAWNAMLLDIPKERIDLIQNVAKNYNIFLLSNTNAIHIEGVEKSLVKSTGLTKLDLIFPKIYYSHQIKMRKPNAEIYDFVLKDSNLKAEETVFIDDNLQNVEGGKNLGIQAIFLDVNKNSVLDLFQNAKIKLD